MFRPLSILFAAGVALFGATAAHADTHWSVGINLPVPGLIIGNGDGYYRDAEPVYYEPAPTVRYAPIPVYGAPSYEPRYGYGYEPRRIEYDNRWQRHREWERARFERWHDGRDGRGWNRGDDRRGDDHRRDDGDARRWHRD